jgi:Tfp pilus assembly protein PilN
MSQQINLYNPIFLKQKHYFSALTMVQALAVVLVGALGIYAFEVWQNRTLERVLAETDQRVAAQREQLLKFAKEYSEQGASRALTDDLAKAEGRLQQRQALLSDLRTGVGGDIQGFSPYLGALAKQATPGVWLTGIEIGARGSSLVLRGRALESRMVPAYIRALNREAPMQGRAVGELQLTARGMEAGVAPATDINAGPSRYIEFSLSIPLKEKS